MRLGGRCGGRSRAGCCSSGGLTSLSPQNCDWHLLRSNASSSWAVGRSLGSEAIHMENRGEGCPHVLTSAWRVAGAGRLHEDYTLRARFENGILALSSKTLWHP